MGALEAAIIYSRVHFLGTRLSVASRLSPGAVSEITRNVLYGECMFPSAREAMGQFSKPETLEEHILPRTSFPPGLNIYLLQHQLLSVVFLRDFFPEKNTATIFVLFFLLQDESNSRSSQRVTVRAAWDNSCRALSPEPHAELVFSPCG